MTDGDDTHATGASTNEVRESLEPNAHTSSNWKVLGEVEANDGVGVLGHNTAGSGATRGVAGVVDSRDPAAAGVFGVTTDPRGDGVGVQGRTDAIGTDTTGVQGDATAGVEGTATAATGMTFGVHGITHSPGDYNMYTVDSFWAAGVRGEATATDGDAISTAGLVGENYSTSGVGHGVLGKTGSGDTGAAAVRAAAEGNAAGVRATSASGVGIEIGGVSTSADDGPAVEDHAAILTDSATEFSSVLALQAGYGDSATDYEHNFVTFYDGSRTAVGAIENEAGGINLFSSGADYAEMLRQVDPDEYLSAGDVVGVEGGAITKRTADVDRAMVVSDQAIVTGNAPGMSSEARKDYEPVAFVGQVPVKVRGTVAEGDLIVPSGEEDGTARAIGPADWRPGDGPLVGRAWEESGTEGVEQVTVAVGLETGEALQEVVAGLGDELDDRDDRIARLEGDNESLRAEVGDLADDNESLRKEVSDLAGENQALRERLDSLEERLARVENGQGSPAVADD